MPTAQNLALFALASILLALTPGPNLLYLVSRTLCQGRRAGIVSLRHVARLRVSCLRRGARAVRDFYAGAGPLRCRSLCRCRLPAVARVGRVAARRAGRVHAARATAGLAMAALPHGPRHQPVESEADDVLSGTVSAVHRYHSRQRAGPELGARAAANSDQLRERPRLRPRRRRGHRLACRRPLWSRCSAGCSASCWPASRYGSPSTRGGRRPFRCSSAIPSRWYARQCATLRSSWRRSRGMGSRARVSARRLRELAALGAVASSCRVVRRRRPGLRIACLGAGGNRRRRRRDLDRHQRANSVVCGPIFAFGTAAQKTVICRWRAAPRSAASA